MLVLRVDYHPITCILLNIPTNHKNDVLMNLMFVNNSFLVRVKISCSGYTLIMYWNKRGVSTIFEDRKFIHEAYYLFAK